MLSYMDVHFWYTLPFTIALAFLARPFVSQSEVFKMSLISVMAVLYTTPWDNYIISSGVWVYPKERVLAFVGHSPVEEYVFFVVQTVMTVLWTLLCVRWTVPCTHFNHDRRSYLLIQWIPIATLGAATVVGYVIATPGQPTFYLGCVLWWVCPVIMFLWYGAGNYLVKNVAPSALAVAAPTLYLCWVDQIALRENVWHITETTSLNVFAAADLPLEEALFFVVSNLLIVLAAQAFDKSRGMMNAYTDRFPLRYATFSGPYIVQTFRAFATPEYAVSSTVTDDVRTVTEIVRREAPAPFRAVSVLFQHGIRLDLKILYAFCHVTNEMINGEPDAGRKKRKYEVIEAFVGELFADRKSDHHVKKAPSIANVDWSRYQSELTDREMASFRAVSRVAFYLPRQPFDELLAGYRWGVEGKPIRNEDDLLLYSSYTTGSVGAMCAYALMYRCDNDTAAMKRTCNRVVDSARTMGRALKLINIAQQIVTDSETLGRCYVPSDYMNDKEDETRTLCINRTPRSLGDKKLTKYSTSMIKLATYNKSELINVIKCLPYETRGPVLAAIEIYQSVFSAIVSSKPSIYLTKVLLSEWNNKIIIGLCALYFKSLQYQGFNVLCI